MSEEATQARVWQDEDYAWADGAVWHRSRHNGSDKFPWSAKQFLKYRSDAQMAAAGAVLLATVDGPIMPAEVADLRAALNRARDTAALLESEQVPRLRPRRPRVTDAKLRQVAEMYRSVSATDVAPVQIIADELGVSKRTASYYVQRARAAGHLGTALLGKAGERNR